MDRAVMDDSDDKIRRNLVAASAAIIFTWFLDLKLAGKVNLFGIVETASVQPRNFWICVTAILVYLMLRFRFDKQTSQLTPVFQHDVRMQHWLITRNMLKRLFMQLDSARNLPKGGSLELGPSSRETTNLQHLLDGNFKGISSFEVHSTTPFSLWRGHGEFHASFRAPRANGTGSEQYNEHMEYRMSRWLTASVAVQLIIRIWLYSPVAMTFMVPITLSCAALGICLWKVSTV